MNRHHLTNSHEQIYVLYLVKTSKSRDVVLGCMEKNEDDHAMSNQICGIYARAQFRLCAVENHRGGNNDQLAIFARNPARGQKTMRDHLLGLFDILGQVS